MKADMFHLATSVASRQVLAVRCVMSFGTTHFVGTREETVVDVHGLGPWGVKYVNLADDPSKN